MPLAARQLVGNLNAVAVRVMEIDADGNAVVGNVVDGDVLFPHPPIELLQVRQAFHHPGHVVQPHLAMLKARSVRPHFNQGDFVGLLQIGGHKGGPAGLEVIGMQPQHIGVPLPGAFRIADKQVDMAQVLGFIAHRSPSQSPLANRKSRYKGNIKARGMAMGESGGTGV